MKVMPELPPQFPEPPVIDPALKAVFSLMSLKSTLDQVIVAPTLVTVSVDPKLDVLTRRRLMVLFPVKTHDPVMVIAVAFPMTKISFLEALPVTVTLAIDAPVAGFIIIVPPPLKTRLLKFSIPEIDENVALAPDIVIVDVPEVWVKLPLVVFHDVPVPVMVMFDAPRFSTRVLLLEELKSPQEWVSPELSVAPSTWSVPFVKVKVAVVPKVMLLVIA